MRVPGNHHWTTLLLMAALIIIAVIYIFPSKTTMAGSHTMYKVKNETSGEIDFCKKCHAEEADNITASAVHNRTECICHGYYPNVTNASIDINLKHQLTKDAYCTNCHSKYNESGELGVYGPNGIRVNVTNQSGHYISNESDYLMNHSARYFGLF